MGTATLHARMKKVYITMNTLMQTIHTANSKKRRKEMEAITIDQEVIQRKIAYFENVIGKLTEAIELETDFERITKLESLLEDAKHELISVRLELE